MTYSIGTHIDLSHINSKQTCTESTTIARTFESFPCDVGTEFVFREVAGNMRMAMRIQVAFS